MPYTCTIQTPLLLGALFAGAALAASSCARQEHELPSAPPRVAPAGAATPTSSPARRRYAAYPEPPKDAPAGDLRIALPAGLVIQGMAFSTDASVLAVAAEDGQVLLYDATTGRPRSIIPPGPTRVMERPSSDFGGHKYAFGSILSLSANGDTLAAARGAKLFLWHTRDGSLRRVLGPPGASAGPIALSPDGRYAAAATEACDVVVWEVASGKLTRTLSLATPMPPGGGLYAPEHIDSLTFSPDASHLVVSARTQGVQYWRLSDGYRCWSEAIGYCGPCLFSGDGKQLVTPDSIVRDAATGAHRWRVEQVDQVWGFSPDERLLAARGFSGEIAFNDLRSGKWCRWIWPNAGRIEAMAFLPGEKALIVESLGPGSLSVRRATMERYWGPPSLRPPNGQGGPTGYDLHP